MSLNMNEITIRLTSPKKCFGRRRYYPACKISRLLCAISRHTNGVERESLTLRQLELIKEAGWTIEYQETT